MELDEKMSELTSQPEPPEPADGPICPRCGGFIPSNENPGAYPGALSRWDNTTEICSQCGVDEALLDHAAGSYRSGGAHLDPKNPKNPWKSPL